MHVDNVVGVNNFLQDRTILVTGGAGSLGSQIVKELLHYNVHSIRVMDNSEYSMFKLKKQLDWCDKIRFFLGDIRDRDRCRMAMREADIIINCSALKNLELTEFNAIETVETNINGLIHLIRGAIYEEPEIFCHISTDKICDANNLYAATKLVDEYLVKWVDQVVRPMIAYSVRPPNYWPSNGSVFEIWEEAKAKNEPIPLTDERMERYFMPLGEAAKFVIKSLTLAKGGEVFIPKAKNYKMIDIAKQYSDNIKIIGIRKGEKLKEELFTEQERKVLKDMGEYWVI